MTLRSGRRGFLRGSLGAAGASFAYACGGSSGGPTVVELDHTLVLGSGFGGCVSALRLSQAGKRVTLLERGRRWPITSAHDTFCSMRHPDGRASWLATQTHIGLHQRVDRYAGIVEKVEGDNIDAIIGAGVGGGSLAYAGMMVRPPQNLFEATFPLLDYAEMDTVYYARAAAQMRLQSVPDEVFESANYQAARAFVDQVMAAGLSPTKIQTAIDWDLVMAEIRGDLPGEAMMGDYIYGLNSGAKGSVDQRYLADAEATGLVEVRPLHEVLAIGHAPGGSGYRVDARRIDELGNTLETITFHAPSLIVATGAVHTPRLLVTARETGALPDLPTEVGLGWGNNGQFIRMRGNLDVDVGAYQGGPPCVVLHHYDNDVAPVTVEQASAAFGYECHCLINPSSSTIDGTGRIRWDATSASAKIEWALENNATAESAAARTAQILNDANGGNVQSLPGANGRHDTFHPLGGCVMGMATDTYGRVRGHEGLYVIDASLIPGVTPTANPSWTIAAIAERAIENVIANDDLG
ncbi:MAG: GMC oxidoreductase [Sandaracinus sp.]